MNKNDLIAAVADSTGLSKADSAKAVDGMEGGIRTMKADTWTIVR